MAPFSDTCSPMRQGRPSGSARFILIPPVLETHLHARPTEITLVRFLGDIRRTLRGGACPLKSGSQRIITPSWPRLCTGFPRTKLIFYVRKVEIIVRNLFKYVEIRGTTGSSGSEPGLSRARVTPERKRETETERAGCPTRKPDCLQQCCTSVLICATPTH